MKRQRIERESSDEKVKDQFVLLRYHRLPLLGTVKVPSVILTYNQFIPSSFEGTINVAVSKILPLPW
jgi:hypothetical protein